MCTSPKYIHNRTSHYRSGLDKLGFQIPCQECDSCRIAEQESWFVRLYSQWMDTIGDPAYPKGCVAFATLTWDESTVPWYVDKNYILQEDAFDIPIYYNRRKKKAWPLKAGSPIRFRCFDYQRILKFIKDLREYAKNKYGITEDIKYFIASEYGPKNTQRSHLHGVFFFPKVISVNVIKDIIEHCWHGFRHGKTGKFVQHNGEVRWSQKYGVLVQSVKALEYVAKYVSKDLNFFRKPTIQKYLQYMADKHGKDSDQWRNIRRFLPRHYQSQLLGESYLMDRLRDPKSRRELFLYGFRTYQGTRFFQLPRWIEQRAYYDYDKKLEYRYLNDFGIECMLEKMHLRYNKQLATLKHNLTEIGCNELLSSQKVIDYLTPIIGKLFSQKLSATTLKDFLLDLLRDTSPEDVISYKNFFRDKTYGFYSNEVFHFQSKDDLHNFVYDCDFYDMGMAYFERCLKRKNEHRTNEKDEPPLLCQFNPHTGNSFYNDEEKMIWNQFSRFADAERFLKVFEHIQQLFYSDKDRKKSNDVERIRITRSHFQSDASGLVPNHTDIINLINKLHNYE